MVPLVQMIQLGRGALIMINNEGEKKPRSRAGGLLGRGVVSVFDRAGGMWIWSDSTPPGGTSSGGIALEVFWSFS
jgi:hypothetical protein